MLNTQENVFVYSAFRVIFDTTIGIIVAFSVNLLVFRPKHKGKNINNIRTFD